MLVACHFNPESRRSCHIASAFADGVRAAGHKAELVTGFDKVAGDVGVAYGWGHPDLFEKYRNAGGHSVYIDLGWWDRKPAGALLDGFHKVVVDGREPGPYFRGGFSSDRFGRQGMKVAPWRETGRHILMAGMSEKSAGTRGWKPHEWECGMADLLHCVTSRPIIYRPKPSWADAKPIPGTIYSPPEQSLDAILRDCWLAVTLHSNVAVDALMAGVPVNVREGVAAEFSTPLNDLETPNRADGREQLMADIAYAQWSVPEMRSGECFRHLLERTPLCA